MSRKFITHSRLMRRVLAKCELYAPYREPILLLGERGTGKTVLARVIHELSGRRGAFVDFAAADVPDSLARSELHGHVRGAFTGASESTTGLIESANHGTVFIDEIGDASVQLQSMLLRLIETAMVRRAGDTRSREPQVRFICATNRDLWAAAYDHDFKPDLLDRFAIQLTLPSLRQRREDIPALVKHFLTHNADLSPAPVAITPEAMRELSSYSWPGNVRELQQVVRLAAIHAQGRTVGVQHLPEKLFRPALPRSFALNGRPPRSPCERRSRALRVLSNVNGNKAAAARILGVSRPTLYGILAVSGCGDRQAESSGV